MLYTRQAGGSHQFTKDTIDIALRKSRTANTCNNESEEGICAPTQLDMNNKQDDITSLKKEMLAAADILDFEKAAIIRDQIRAIETNSADPAPNLHNEL